MNRACYIFFYEGYVSLAPTILNLSKLLDKYGYLVTILATQNNEIPQPEKIANRAKVRYFPKLIKLYLFFDQPRLRILVRILEVIIFCFQSVSYLLKHSHGREKARNNINIGVDLHGLIVALIWLYFFKQKFIFLSLELEQPRKFKYITKPFSKIAKLAYKKAESVIVQDEDRFKTLCEYYRYQHPKVFYLPNSTLNDWVADAKATQFLRDIFNLSKEKFPYIVLYAGQLNDVVYSKSLAHAFASIDNGCALIFHGVDPRGLKEEDPYIQSLRQVNSKNLFLSLNLLPHDQVDKIYASSTIGIAFYANPDDNHTKIAMASGKLAQYLKHGKPVLVSNFPSLFQLIEKYQIGIVINNPSDVQEIKVAIDKILSSYDNYSKNAKCCFEAEFDFAKKMGPILSFMDCV